MIHIDLLNPHTIADFVQTKKPASTSEPSSGPISTSISTQTPRQGRTLPTVIGINVLILVVVITVIMLIPPDWLPSGLGRIVRQAQTAFTRLFNTIM